MQCQNVTEELFDAGAGGFLSGNPLKKIADYSVEDGGPIMKQRCGAGARPTSRTSTSASLNFFDASKGGVLQHLVAAQKNGTLGSLVTYDNLDDVRKCLSNDQTMIKDIKWKFNYQLNTATSSGTCSRATTRSATAAAPARRRRRKRRPSSPATSRGACRCRRTR